MSSGDTELNVCAFAGVTYGTSIFLFEASKANIGTDIFVVAGVFVALLVFFFFSLCEQNTHASSKAKKSSCLCESRLS